MGRQTLLNNELADRICESIAKGTTDWRAAEMAGVSKDAFYLWMRKGKKGHPRYVKFVTKVFEARAKAVSHCEQLVLTNDPRFFLRYSPVARDRPGEPGWNGFSERLDLKAHLSHEGRVDVNLDMKDVLANKIAEMSDRLRETEVALGEAEEELREVV